MHEPMNDENDILNNVEMMTDEKWQAIITNDTAYNNQFFYAVKSTGIFCKPSCKSRVPKKVYVFLQQQNKHSTQIFALVNVASLLMKICLIASGLISSQHTLIKISLKN